MNMWLKSRTDSGKSQRFMADSLGVSRRTIQYWEDGTSSPSQEKAFAWFDALGLPALPYYLEALYPNEFGDLSTKSSDDQVETALTTFIHGMSPEMQRKLLYILFCEHGSSLDGLLDMLCAHYHTPMRNRLTVAQNICTNYEVAEHCGELIGPNHVRPNIRHLKEEIIKVRNAVLERNDRL